MSSSSLPARVPRHVAIIMDGNGRWAQNKNKPRIYGHIRGASRVKPIVRLADRLGIEALTLFAFSTENWARPKSEIQVLWKLMRKYLIREVIELEKENVQLNIIGQLDRLESPLKELIEEVQERLSGNTGLVFPDSRS